MPKQPARKIGKDSHTLLPLKMAASSLQPRTEIAGIGNDLSNITKQINYRTFVSYLPDTHGMDIQVFDQDSLSNQYHLDTSHCVTKSKHFNNRCLYDTFAEHCTLSGVEVKKKLILELRRTRTRRLVCKSQCFMPWNAWFEEEQVAEKT